MRGFSGLWQGNFPERRTDMCHFGGVFRSGGEGGGVGMSQRMRGTVTQRARQLTWWDAPSGLGFAPGAPPAPGAGITLEHGAPRQFTFPAGYNIASQPRAYETTPFAVLRQFAALYEGIQLCERAYLDILGRLEPRIVGSDGQGVNDATARAIGAWLAMPDGERDLRAWMAAATRDLLEIDAVAIYRRRRRDGKLMALELVDGTTVKPLLDGLGRRPAPPAPAFQQFVWGMPAGLYTADALDYLCESPRTDSLYGTSRVERILLCVNQALRKQAYDLARFTDGVVPAGILTPPANSEWTPDEVTQFEQHFNDLLAGNDQQRMRVKIAPAGFTFTPTHPQEPEVEFDRWLLNLTAACFGLTMAELGITEQVNKSSGDSQENVVYRRAVRPLADFFARYLSRVIAEEFDPRYRLTWTGFEEPEDFATKAHALAELVQCGIVTPERAAGMLGIVG